MTRLALGTLIALVAVAGCGGGGRANVSAGPMPDGGSYSGIWHSPQYGEMHMAQSGSQIHGCYVMNERVGRIQGSIEGNLMRFEWSERREMVVGRPTLTRGRGYFLYQVGGDGDHYIEGQWGHDDNESGGGPWRAVRDRRRSRRPNPESCGQGGDSGGGEETEGGESFGSGGGDSGGGDSGGGDSFGGSGSGSGSGSGGGDDGLGDL